VINIPNPIVSLIARISLPAALLAVILVATNNSVGSAQSPTASPFVNIEDLMNRGIAADAIAKYPHFASAFSRANVAPCVAEGPDDDARASAFIRQGYQAGLRTPSVKTEHKMQTFNSGKHSFELTPPEDYSLQDTPCPGGRAFVFSGPRRKDGKSAVMSIAILSESKKEQLPPVDIMLDSMLDPFRKHLFDYKEHKEEPITVNGNSYEGMSYAGAVGTVFPIRGCFFVARVRDVMVIVSGQDSATFYNTTLSEPMKAFGTLKILQ
jgi:hypothetical protein